MSGLLSWLSLATASATVLLSACATGKPLQPGSSPAGIDSRSELVSSTLVPGVLIDTLRNLVYIMKPGGGIEALDIDSGAQRWATSHADQPLFATSTLLAARVGSPMQGLVIEFLDPETGRLAGEGGEPSVLPLPSGVLAGIDQSLGRSFTHEVVESEGDVYLAWEFVEHDVSGVSPPDGRPFVRRETGIFRYNINTGSFEAAAPDSIAVSTDGWPKELQALVESTPGTRRIWHGDSVFALAEQRYSPDELILRRWRRKDGTALEDRTLYAGRAMAALGSCDDNHAVVVEPGDPTSPAAFYLLRFYSLDTGQIATELPSDRSARPFCIIGPRLLLTSPPAARRIDNVMVESPLETVATDFSSGNEVWRREVRDTAFRGPFPPGR